MRLFLLLPLLLLMSFRSDDLPAYLIYDRQGNPVSYGQMIKSLQEADVVLFGELHNNPLCHWLQLRTLRSLHEAKSGKLVLGAEMFEADAQPVLDEYLAGLIKENHLTAEGKTWDNYKTDYAPLVNFAKEQKLPFIATNVPRRYANIVSRMGMEALTQLPKDQRKYIAPLPIEVDMTLPGYQQMKSMMGGHGGPAGDQFVHAQAIKDATMAHFIARHTDKDRLFLHFHGTYHSNNFEGICWYLRRENKKLRQLTIASVEQDQIQTLSAENKGIADFVICLPSDMTKTY